MVESVETDIPHSPQNAREAAEKAVAAEQLAQATALLNDRITKISNDPSISPDDKRKLIDQLNGVKGTTNLQAIYSVMQEVSAQTASAEANSSYELSGNVMQVKGELSYHQAEQVFHDIHLTQAAMQRVEAASRHIENDHDIVVVARAYRTPNTPPATAAELDREAVAFGHTAAGQRIITEHNAQPVEALKKANTLGEKAGEAARQMAADPKTPKPLQTALNESAELGANFSQEGIQAIADAKRGVPGSTAELQRANQHHRNRMAALLPNALNVLPAEEKQALAGMTAQEVIQIGRQVGHDAERMRRVEAYNQGHHPNADPELLRDVAAFNAKETMRTYATMEEVTEVAKRAMFQSMGQGKDQIQSSVQAYKSLAQGDDKSRVEAYISAYNAYNAQHHKPAADPVQLRQAAESYVEKHKPVNELISYAETMRADHKLIRENQKISNGDSKLANAYRDQLTANTKVLMELTGAHFNAVEREVLYTGIMIDSAAQNARTAAKTTIVGAVDILTGDEKGIDRAGRGVGIMTAKVASAVGFDAAHAQQIGHAATELAQTAGHKISGAIQTGEHALGAVASAGSDLMSWGAAKLGMGTAHAAPPAKPNPQTELQAVRRAADTNHDGKLSGAEVSAYLNAHGAVHKDANKPVTNAELVAASHHRPTPQQAAAQARAGVNAQFAAAEAKFGLDPHQAHSLAEIKKAMHDHGVKDADIAKMLEGGLSKGEVIQAAQHLPSHKPAPHGKPAHAH